MDIHHVLANLSISSMTDTVAFSALPNAPVLADLPTRRDRFTSSWRARRAGSMQTPPLHRPAAASLRAAKAAPQRADTCRMVA